MIEKREDIIAGRNAVAEAVKAGRTLDCIMTVRGEKSGNIVPLLAQCRKKGLVIKEVSKVKLDALCDGGAHQGIIALVPAAQYSSVADMLALASERGEQPFLIIADEINDPHNLGAIIRTAECAGAHGVILPKHRAAGLTFAVSKAAAGALEYLPVAKVTNLTKEIEMLKEQGFWIYGADMGGSTYTKTDFTGAIALVIGSEGGGIGRLVKEQCDHLVSIPLKGKISSLNASVAAGVLMMEIANQRAKAI